MKVGVLELLTGVRLTNWTHAIGHYLTTKQYASIMPQAIAVWCRQSGHEVFYATYYGQGDPKRLLPNDLDVVFIAGHTQTSALSYALAKLYRREKTLTVIGGPHAKSFPHDCYRHFDVVVLQCDKPLITDILSGGVEPNSIVSSRRSLSDLPSVEERMAYIRTSAFCRGKRPYLSTTVPLLSSVGCPYACDFCTDWDNVYELLPPDRLREDLRYLSRYLPNVRVAYHDPNFAVKFDATLDLLETVPTAARNPYIMETSLSFLDRPRLQRLRDTNCVFIAPGVESWNGYSNKAGVGTKTNSEKVQRVVEHITLVHEYVPGIQVNFIFGLDDDEGDEPVELTKEFMNRTPFAWPTISIPVPYGGTPLYDRYQKEGRILTSMPLAFYSAPYLVTTLKHYDPVIYYQKLIELLIYSSTRKMLLRRLRSTSNWESRLYHVVRTLGMWERIRKLRKILEMMTTDSQFRAFHEGESTVLPEFYRQEYLRLLGPYALLR